MGITYPEENEDPHWESMESFFQGVDTHLFAGYEDRGVFLTGGGTFTWDAETGTLEWDADVVLNTLSTGILQTLAAGSQEIADGEIWYVDMTRGALSAVELESAAASSVSANTATLPLAFRIGDILYFRNGTRVEDGFSGGIFDTASAAIAAHEAKRIDQGHATMTLAQLNAMITDATIRNPEDDQVILAGQIFG